MERREFKLVPNSGIMATQIYQGGEQPNSAYKNIIKLNSNENPLGPSKYAIQALKSSFDFLNYYPCHGMKCNIFRSRLRGCGVRLCTNLPVHVPAQTSPAGRSR